MSSRTSLLFHVFCHWWNKFTIDWHNLYTSVALVKWNYSHITVTCGKRRMFEALRDCNDRLDSLSISTRNWAESGNRAEWEAADSIEREIESEKWSVRTVLIDPPSGAHPNQRLEASTHPVLVQWCSHIKPNALYDRQRGELSYLAPLGSENISAPYFKQCFFQGRGV